jgi:hypothetical protein
MRICGRGLGLRRWRAHGLDLGPPRSGPDLGFAGQLLRAVPGRRGGCCAPFSTCNCCLRPFSMVSMEADPTCDTPPVLHAFSAGTRKEGRQRAELLGEARGGHRLRFWQVLASPR